MPALEPGEKELRGRWLVKAGKIVGDGTTQRIEWLTAHVLDRVATDPTGWEVLLRDPADGRFLELTYAEGWQHGGGPPRLAALSKEEAARKYGL